MHENDKSQVVLEENSMTQIIQKKLKEMNLDKGKIFETYSNENRIVVVLHKEFNNKIYEVFKTNYFFKEAKIIENEGFLVDVEPNRLELNIKLKSEQTQNAKKIMVEATCEFDFPENDALREKIEQIIRPRLEMEKEKLFAMKI
jgi:hypothetical protein